MVSGGGWAIWFIALDAELCEPEREDSWRVFSWTSLDDGDPRVNDIKLAAELAEFFRSLLFESGPNAPATCFCCSLASAKFSVYMSPVPLL